MTIPKGQLIGKIFFSGESKLEAPPTDSFTKPQPIPSPFAEHLPTQGPTVANAGLNELAHQGEIAKQVVDGPTIEAAKAAGTHLEVAAGSGDGIEDPLKKELAKLGVKNPGAVAHRIVDDYAKKHNVSFKELNNIKSAKFDLVADGKDGYHIDKLDFKSIAHHAHEEGTGNASQVAENVQSEELAANEKIVNDSAFENEVNAANPYAGGVEHAQPAISSANLEAINDSAFENEVNATNPYAGEVEGARSDLAAAGRAVEEAASRHVAPPGGTFLHDENFGPRQVIDLHGPDADRVAVLAADREMHARFLEQIGAKSNTFHDITKSSAKELAKGEFGKWQAIKDASYKDTINQYGMKTRMTKLLGKFENLLGKEAIKPQGGGSEKMGHYIARLSKMAAERGSK